MSQFFIELSATPPPPGFVQTLTANIGINPVPPNGSDTIFIGTTLLAASSVPLTTFGNAAANSVIIEMQVTTASATSILNNVGLASFNSAQFAVDSFGYVSLSGTGAGQTITTQDGSIVAPIAGNWNVSGASVAAHLIPVTTVGNVGTGTITVDVQLATANAVTTTTRPGLASFDSARFTVDANGFVSANGTGLGETITGDSGGALSPTAGNWNIFGRSGSKTSGSGSTLTINSPPFSQIGSSSTSVLNSGEFVTAAVTRTLPATAGLLDGDLVIYYCTTAGALVVTANTGQTIRIGTLVSSSAGTATSTAIGDSLTLRFDATAVSWRAVSVIGTWVMA